MYIHINIYATMRSDRCVRRPLSVRCPSALRQLSGVHPPAFGRPSVFLPPSIRPPSSVHHLSVRRTHDIRRNWRHSGKNCGEHMRHIISV